MIFLNKEEIIQINKNAIKLYGGSFGIRDVNLLESSVAFPINNFYYSNPLQLCGN